MYFVFFTISTGNSLEALFTLPFSSIICRNGCSSIRPNRWDIFLIFNKQISYGKKSYSLLSFFHNFISKRNFRFQISYKWITKSNKHTRSIIDTLTKFLINRNSFCKSPSSFFTHNRETTNNIIINTIRITITTNSKSYTFTLHIIIIIINFIHLFLKRYHELHQH